MYLPADSQNESMLGVQSDLKLAVCISTNSLHFTTSGIDLPSTKSIDNLGLRFPCSLFMLYTGKQGRGSRNWGSVSLKDTSKMHRRDSAQAGAHHAQLQELRHFS